ncbi:hypothetical protein K402DRAFT_454776 [Aulographum hederae CBS 113979]|uniref:Uncharacterized protein n=1 Tax=Aulographum hederae CBS 113979 TaxID=1176131 RepID=A0A6G1GY82_9PEZI|nr:hypothetical protein K402DRAFT_454776 [Aulographum hederae CBS 113979]
MDPSVKLANTITQPKFAYSTMVPAVPEHDVPWNESYLDPKNRVKDLGTPEKPSWQVHGVDPDGARFFVIRDFAIFKGSRQIQIHIPDLADHPYAVRIGLQSAQSVVAQGEAVCKLDFTRILVQGLHRWSANIPGFEQMYLDLPFGSCIVIEELHVDIYTWRIQVVPQYDTERSWVSIERQCQLWHFDEEKWPKCLDVDQICRHRQSHEAISLVSVVDEPLSTLFIFKSVLHEPNYLYHELKLLLTMGSHENIMIPPPYVVKKR